MRNKSLSDSVANVQICCIQKKTPIPTAYNSHVVPVNIQKRLYPPVSLEMFSTMLSVRLQVSLRMLDLIPLSHDLIRLALLAGTKMLYFSSLNRDLRKQE